MARGSRHERQVVARKDLRVSPVVPLPKGLLGVGYDDESNIDTSKVPQGSVTDVIQDIQFQSSVFWIMVAAHNAPDEWKAAADFVCSGVDDQDTINEADEGAFTLGGYTLSGPYDPNNDPESSYGYGIILSPGDYYISGAINLYNTNAIYGAIPNAVNIIATTAFSAGASWADNMIYLAGTSGATEDNYGWSRQFWVKNLVLNGNGLINPSTQLTGIETFNTYFIEDCEFIGLGQGVAGFDFSGEHNIIRGSMFWHCAYGVSSFDTGHTKIVDCLFTQNDCSVWASNDQMVLVKDSVFYLDGDFGGDTSPAASPALSGGVFVEDQAIIDGCTFSFNFYTRGAVVDTGSSLAVISKCGSYGSSLNQQTLFASHEGSPFWKVVIEGCWLEYSVIDIDISTFGPGESHLEFIDNYSYSTLADPIINLNTVSRVLLERNWIEADNGLNLVACPQVKLIRNRWDGNDNVSGVAINVDAASDIEYFDEQFAPGSWFAEIVNAGSRTHTHTDDYYRHIQGASATTWNISHNLQKFPSIKLKNGAGQEFMAEITHTDENNAVVTLAIAQSGEAMCS